MLYLDSYSLQSAITRTICQCLHLGTNDTCNSTHPTQLIGSFPRNTTHNKTSHNYSTPTQTALITSQHHNITHNPSPQKHTQFFISTIISTSTKISFIPRVYPRNPCSEQRSPRPFPAAASWRACGPRAMRRDMPRSEARGRRGRAWRRRE